jgi:hypothetical protein
MKRIFLSVSGLFGAIPGLAIIASGIGVPPSYKALFGGVIEAFGALALLLLWANRERLRWMPSSRLTRIVALMGGVSLSLIIAYVIMFNSCVITHQRGDAYFPIYSSGDLAVMVERGRSREGAIDRYGVDAVREAIRQMGAFPLALTTAALLLVYQGIFTSLTIAFGLAGLVIGGELQGVTLPPAHPPSAP